jgi:5-methylcytosine-specific restriction endonuclease McrA
VELLSKMTKRYTIGRIDRFLGRHYSRRRDMFDNLFKPYRKALRADVCAYCGNKGGTLDHIVPRYYCEKDEKGGLRSDNYNLTGACTTCNNEKQTESLLLFLLEK